MAVFTIQSPDGRKIKIDAADEATAVRGAQEWVSANPASVKLTGKVEPQGSAGEPSQNVQGLNPQGSYDFALDRVQREYLPDVPREKVAEMYAPYDTGKLFNAGLTFGFNDEAAGAGNAVGEATRGKDFGRAFSDYTDLERARQGLGAEKAGPVGVAAEMGGALLAGRPDMAAGRVAGLIPSMMEGAKGGAVAGGLYGFGSSDGNLVERTHDAAGGALVGAGFGAAIPAAVAGAKRVISPTRPPQAKVDATNVLRNEGVELTAGQATGNKGLQYREAELGGGAAEAFAERQADQFTAAALRRAGVTADRATPDMIDQAYTQIGQQFDGLASRNTLTSDPRLAGELRQVWRDYSSLVNPSQRSPIIEQTIVDITDALRNSGGRLPGRTYQSLRSRLERAARGSRDPELTMTLRDINAALDGAMERSIGRANPTDLGAWQEARRSYRNMMVIEDAAVRAGEKSADGIITPANLRSAAKKQGRRGFSRGHNDFAALANAGVSAMTPLPNSGTAARLGAKMFVPAGAATGAAIGGATAGPLGAGVGAAVGAAVPWAAGRAILSGPGRAYLTNQVAAQPVGELAALLGSGVGRAVQPLVPGR